jgi:hypothetical protein
MNIKIESDQVDNSGDKIPTFRCWTNNDDPAYRYHKIVETRTMDIKVIKVNEFCINEIDLKRLQESNSLEEQKKILIELMNLSECNKTEERKYWIGFDESYGHDEYCETKGFIGFDEYNELLESDLNRSDNNDIIVHNWPNSTLEPKEIKKKPYHIFEIENFLSSNFFIQ